MQLSTGGSVHDPLPDRLRVLDAEGLPAGGAVHADLVMGVPGGCPGRPRHCLVGLTPPDPVAR